MKIVTVSTVTAILAAIRQERVHHIGQAKDILVNYLFSPNNA